MALLALCVAPGWAAGDMQKCRQNGRIIYQNAPCPADSVPLALEAPLPPPDTESISRAQARAKADMDAAEAIRVRKAREEAELRAIEAEAERHAQDCARLLAIIREIETLAPSDKDRRTPRKATAERKEYLKKCGPP